MNLLIACKVDKDLINNNRVKVVKAHGELIVYQSSGVCVSVNSFKHEYLRNQQADCNQILSEASLGWGKGCIRFLARSDRTSGFHGNR